MAILLPFASLTGYLLFLLRFTTWPGAFLPFFTISSLMCLLYAAAVMGMLLPGTYFLTALGLAAGFGGAYFSRGKIKEYFARLLEPGTAVFLGLAILLWAAYGGTQYSAWDEFSHWGLTIKEIFAQNALLTANSVIACKDYPPATALFQYYITVFTGWSEGITCVAHAAITLAAAVVFLTGIPWRQWLKITAILTFLQFLVIIFSFSLQNLYVDHLLGFFFGAILISYFMAEDRGTAAVLRLAPVLFILPLIKSAGTLMALIAGGIIVADQLQNRSSLKPGAGRSRNFAALVLCAFILLTPLLSARTWSWRIAALNLPQTLSTKVGLPEIKRPFSAAATERDKVTLQNFSKAFFSTRAGRTFPPVFILLLLTGAGCFLAGKAKHPGERAGIRTATLLMFTGFIIYTAGILFLYLYSFGNYEGPRLASFGRYMSIFFLAWTLLTLIFLLRSSAARDARLVPVWAKALIVLAAAVFLIKGALHKTPQGMIDLRITVREKAARALPLIPGGAKIYLVWQNDTGLGPQVAAYELAPHPTSIRSGPWSLGKPYYPGDVWTSDIAPEIWQKLLTGYDYVLLGKTDNTFWDRYGNIFENPSTTREEYLFKVTVKNGDVRLQPQTANS
ncbi:MAG: hypothetical protein A2234_04055 [Elusimicrobia bacterium RIFOXYA2_FULL_58_8]|nr:MAG: hypothetical protein A2285_09870 [Elusimicrobia bacterium RIFOXYA12_FULL_57_11]OGS15449.1 MAG: hypothetical protein A2234_04055 [Elusimicrobia bacterium RIFOXYA2_FULL_58_8]